LPFFASEVILSPIFRVFRAFSKSLINNKIRKAALFYVYQTTEMADTNH